MQCSSVVSSWLSVLWRCWLGGRKGIRPGKNWVLGCWRGYLSGARCRFAYCPADATATHCLFCKIQIGFAFLVPAHPGSPGKTAVKRVCVCLCVCVCLRYQSWSPMCRIALTRFMLSHCLTWRNLTQQLTTSLIVVKNRLSVAAWISGVFLVSVCTAAAPCLLTISVKYLLLLSPIHWISLYLSCVGWGWLGSRVVTVLDSGAEGPGSNCSRDAVGWQS